MSLLLLFQPGLTHYSLACDPGAFTATGTAATFQAARRITADAAAYALAGTAASLRAWLKVAANPGAVALTGQNAGLTAARGVPANGGAVAIAGSAASLLATRLVSAQAGAASIDGTQAGLTYTPVVAAQPGTPAGGPQRRHRRMPRFYVEKPTPRHEAISCATGDFRITGGSARFHRGETRARKQRRAAVVTALCA